MKVELSKTEIVNEIYTVDVPDDIADDEEAVYQYALEHDVEPTVVEDTELEFIEDIE